MAYRCGTVTRSAFARARSAVHSKGSLFVGEGRASSPRFYARIVNDSVLPQRRFLSPARLPSELACAQSLIPLHGAVAAARLKSCPSVCSQSCRALSQSTRGRPSPGGKGGNNNTQDQSEADWRDWVATKLPGTGSNSSKTSHGFGFGTPLGGSDSSVESADDFERRMFGGFNDNDSQADSFFQKLDRLEKARGKTDGGLGNQDWKGNLGWEDDPVGNENEDTLADGMDDRLKRATLSYDYGELKRGEDYSFRPDTKFTPGTQYTVKDLDLTKPAVRRTFQRPTLEVTTEEVLRKADFRNVRFLANFITEAGIILPRRKTFISAKAQRKLAREIKTARAFGLMPFTSMGKKAFVFGKSMEDLDEDYEFDDYDINADELEEMASAGAEDMDIPE